MNINGLKGYSLIRNKKTTTEQIQEKINNAQNTLDVIENGELSIFENTYTQAILRLRKTWNSFIENPYSLGIREMIKHDLCIVKIYTPLEVCKEVEVINSWIGGIETYISDSTHIQSLIIGRISKHMEVISPYALDTAKIHIEQARLLFPDDQNFIDRLNKIGTSDVQSKTLVTSTRKLAESKIGP